MSKALMIKFEYLKRYPKSDLKIKKKINKSQNKKDKMSETSFYFPFREPFNVGFSMLKHNNFSTQNS